MQKLKTRAKQRKEERNTKNSGKQCMNKEVNKREQFLTMANKVKQCNEKKHNEQEQTTATELEHAADLQHKKTQQERQGQALASSRGDQGQINAFKIEHCDQKQTGANNYKQWGKHGARAYTHE